MAKFLTIFGGTVLLALIAGFVIKESPPAPSQQGPKMPRLDLSTYSSAAVQDRLRLLFIHHSCGGQLLAPQGVKDDGESCIYDAAENGGGLRPRLEAAGYEVHEASYNSKIGHDTDIFHWLPKFKDQMDLVLKVDHQDTFFEDGRSHDIVMFKSCYPNNVFVGPGKAPGDPGGPELTVENAKATYRALLTIFAKHPEKLFVVVTAPPRVFKPDRIAKTFIKHLLRRPTLAQSGPWARTFNTWLVDIQGGWLAEYEPKNVVVLDYYDVLTGYGASDFSVYGSGPDASDDHPSAEGNSRAAEIFAPFLNQAVRRAGLSR